MGEVLTHQEDVHRMEHVVLHHQWNMHPLQRGVLLLFLAHGALRADIDGAVGESLLLIDLIEDHIHLEVTQVRELLVRLLRDLLGPLIDIVTQSSERTSILLLSIETELVVEEQGLSFH